MDNLPKDIVKLIKSYVFANCERCKNLFNVKYNNVNITTVYAKEFFNDDFPFPRIFKSYKYICNKCIDELKGEDIKRI